ncbi:peptide methionine sulfoxide reductase B5-like protein, partial [Tanacetum coccineum]
MMTSAGLGLSSSILLFNQLKTSKNQISFTKLFNNNKRGFKGGIIMAAGANNIQKSEDEWRAVLSPEQFRILRQKGT